MQLTVFLKSKKGVLSSRKFDFPQRSDTSSPSMRSKLSLRQHYTVGLRRCHPTVYDNVKKLSIPILGGGRHTAVLYKLWSPSQIFCKIAQRAFNRSTAKRIGVWIPRQNNIWNHQQKSAPKLGLLLDSNNELMEPLSSLNSRRPSASGTHQILALQRSLGG